ncbi:ABC transporter permease [Panacibacter ginsenosidivorans]|uniref:ABC transporter permease n=1 Tax=Panacibacter ginsenosidivorans TaxID=1813871 RepID=A0A5B8VDV0_9BACT|nr:FtsX-like permease family protein [Panacibacter ginsenosidivorans]QEC69183.1 ABC transporter permease [Panacibacter ginsenosidivorans]
MLIKVAWRNIWRNKTRSLVIIAAVAIGLWAGFFLMSFYNGLIEQRISAAIETEISHIQIHHSKFSNDYDIQYYIPYAENLLQQTKKNSLVKAAAGRVIIKGMISTASGSSGIQINGVMPAEEDHLTQLKNKLVNGTYFTASKPYEIIVSEKTLKKLKLKLNAKTILTFQDRDGNIASGAFRIIGIYKTVNTPYDESNVFVNICDIDTLAGITHQYNEIALLLRSGKEVENVKQQLQKEYPQLEIKTWTEISPEMNLLVSASDQTMLIYMGIIMLALAFGIINTMLMAVLERTREIGMLLALGMNRIKVFTMILLETVFLVFAGTPVGIAFGLSTIAYTHKSGINLKQFSEAYSSLGYSSLIYPTFNARQFFLMLAMVIATALVASLLPARRALKLKPAEAIRR